jgi:hypothetical protein
MIRSCLALVVLLTLSSVSHAALRTFTITSGGTTGGNSISPVGATQTFSYVAGAFGNNSVGSNEMLSGFSIQHSDFPGTVFSLDRMTLMPHTRYVMIFEDTNNVNNTVQILLGNGAFFNPASGQDLPNGSSVPNTVQVNYYVGTTFIPGSAISNASITIGTAIPEPSAVGFGALALAATGVGRWARRRFFVVA